AFGIHVLLGSQTLGGAYSLARSTLGQMAVRIALECSESDANLILSEGNTAARLLSRPGEAIYNDANGRLEGNKTFQIAWLPDAEREKQLQRVHELARERAYAPPTPQVVFEGNAPADLDKSEVLAELLAAPAKSYFLDGSRPDSEFAGHYARLAESLPHATAVGSWRETPALLNEIAAELQRRTTENDPDAPAIFLLVHDLGRFRDLRRDE